MRVPYVPTLKRRSLQRLVYDDGWTLVTRYRLSALSNAGAIERSDHEPLERLAERLAHASRLMIEGAHVPERVEFTGRRVIERTGFLDAGTLEHGTVAPRHRTRAAYALLDTLEALHDAGYGHGDAHPRNWLIAERPMLVDFETLTPIDEADPWDHDRSVEQGDTHRAAICLQYVEKRPLTDLRFGVELEQITTIRELRDAYLSLSL